VRRKNFEKIFKRSSDNILAESRSQRFLPIIFKNSRKFLTKRELRLVQKNDLYFFGVKLLDYAIFLFKQKNFFSTGGGVCFSSDQLSTVKLKNFLRRKILT